MRWNISRCDLTEELHFRLSNVELLEIRGELFVNESRPFLWSNRSAFEEGRRQQWFDFFPKGHRVFVFATVTLDG